MSYPTSPTPITSIYIDDSDLRDNHAPIISEFFTLEDRTRYWVSITLTLLFASIILFLLAASVFSDKVDAAKEAVQIALPAVTGIYAAVIGFYFGERSASGAGANTLD